MKKSTVMIAWISYCVSVLMLLYAFLLSHHKFTYMSYSAIVMLIPWIICIVDSIKSKKNANGLWVWLIIVSGLIFIPLWLIYHGKDSNPKTSTADSGISG